MTIAAGLDGPRAGFGMHTKGPCGLPFGLAPDSDPQPQMPEGKCEQRLSQVEHMK